MGLHGKNNPAAIALKPIETSQRFGIPAGQRKATLVDVARVAGVAPITVSRVINQPGQVKQKTLLKVRQAIEEIGYVPNLVAGALATSRSRLVAVFLPVLTNPIFSDMFQVITDRLSAAGYQVLLGVSGYNAEAEQKQIQAILSRRPDGVILTGTVHTDVSRKLLRAARIPVVETWDMTPDPIDMLVGFSHEDIGREMAYYLIAKGYRRFGYVEVDDPRGAKRTAAFFEALAGYGITDVPTETFPAPASLRYGIEGLRKLLPHLPGEGPLAVVCTSDTMAHGVLLEAARQGLHVPKDIAVMGHGDMYFAANLVPSLTTVRVEGDQIGKLAADALLERLESAHDLKPLKCDVGFTIVQRESA